MGLANIQGTLLAVQPDHRDSLRGAVGTVGAAFQKRGQVIDNERRGMRIKYEGGVGTQTELDRLVGDSGAADRPRPQA